jgi:methionyl aminopeptidase
MEEKDLEKLIKAGKIAKEVQSSINIKLGDRIEDIANRGESKIKELGAEPAFPNNISINEIAAHDTAMVKDDRTIGEKDVVKFDMGVHIDGLIVDGGITYDFSGEYGKMLEASKMALENAIAKVKAGVTTDVLGKEIEDTAKKYGFVPIENLGGHQLMPYVVHAGKSIPNYSARKGEVLEEDDLIAIEPFVTNGAGHVVEMARSEIFMIADEVPTRNNRARQLFAKIFEERKTLPFAERWYVKDVEDKIAFRELIRNGSLSSYPVLKEKANGIVAQFEHTMIVEKTGAKILF